MAPEMYAQGGLTLSDCIQRWVLSVVHVEFGHVKERGEAEMLEILLAKAVGSYLEYCNLAAIF